MKTYIVTLTNSKGESRVTRMDHIPETNEYRILVESKEGKPYDIAIHASEVSWTREAPNHPIGTYFSIVTTEDEVTLVFRNTIQIKQEVQTFCTPF